MTLLKNPLSRPRDVFYNMREINRLFTSEDHIMSIDIGIIETPTVRQMFMERIAGMIVSGELQPGDKLPSERDMAAQAKISKSAVHFAMVELERMGFVKTILRQGTYVRDFTRTGTAESLNLLTSTKNFHYTPDNVRDIIDMRDAIESAALERLAESLNDEAIRAFEEDIEKSRAIMEEGRPKGDATDNKPVFTGPGDFPHLDVPKLAMSFFDYHHDLCVYSGNFVLPLIFNTFKDSTSYFWEQPIKEYGPERCIEFMEAMHQTVLEKDARKSKAYLRGQLELYRDVIAGNKTF